MTLGLLKAAMVEKVEDEGARVFLIDGMYPIPQKKRFLSLKVRFFDPSVGFPRSMDRALLFESTICKPSLVLLLECSEDVLEKRLLGRAATLGRSDDTVEVIRKRFKTFDHETAEVIGYYEKEGKLRRVDASEEVGVVYRGVELALGGLVCEVAAGGS